MLSFTRGITRTARFSQKHRFASSLVVCEHKDGAVDAAFFNTVSAATAIGGDVSVLVAGKGSAAAVEAVSKTQGVSKILKYASEAFDGRIAENVSELVGKLQEENKFSHVFFSATNEGKNVMPRVAARLDGAAFSEIIKVNSETSFVRPMYAGNALATVSSSHEPKVFTVRGTNFEKADDASGSAEVVDVADMGDAVISKQVSFVSEAVEKSDRPEITAADVVIAGGRALKSAENFDILYKLADKFPQGAAVGASRAAVDAGYAPNDMQIGQTGKVCAPPLYFAIGISGAIQHLAGMKDSKCIVAINTDEEAPIFQVADYGLKQDLFEAVPYITEKI